MAVPAGEALGIKKIVELTCRNQTVDSLFGPDIPSVIKALGVFLKTQKLAEIPSRETEVPDLDSLELQMMPKGY
jgi:hypothetical protein